MDDEKKITVFNILKSVGFYNNIRKKGLKSARMRKALHDLPKAIHKIQNPPSLTIENVEDSSDLQGERVKIILPSNITDIYTRLQIILGLKLSGHTNTLTEAINLLDELYKRGEIQNKQQYRNALDKLSTL